MAAYAGFASLADYLTQRCRSAGITPNSLAVRLSYPRNYIHALILGRFLPSRTRAEAIARFFGDAPEIVFVLAGLQSAPAPADRAVQEIADLARTLPRKGKREALEFLRWLAEKYRPA